MPPESLSRRVGLLIEERAREFERAVSDRQDVELASYLDGLEGPARSSLIARLVELEESLSPGSREAPARDAASLPRHDRFRPIRRLGAGGMGVVYEAWDRERCMSVALKTIQRLSPESLMLFKQEFRSLAKIAHPNLISLYELFSDGEQWFFSMEFVENARDLKQALRGETIAEETPTVDLAEDPTSVSPAPGAVPDATAGQVDLDYDRFKRIFVQVAEGVTALHRADKLHRDLKPGNVLVRPDERVLLLDFGLVAELVRRPGTSPGGGGAGVVDARGAVMGTIGYMSPEQMAGKSIGTAGDWYAFGVMIFESLTGCRPFQGNRLETIRRRQVEDSFRPSSINPSVPADLDQLCLYLLQPRPEKRPTGDEVLRCLTRGEPKRSVAPPEHRHFIGRERELAALGEALGEASAGERRVVNLHGRSGVGKSALVQRFLQEVQEQESAMILAGRCYEQETVPYKAFDSVVDTLATELRRMHRSDIEAVLPEGITALARIFPVLGMVPGVSARGSEPRSRDLESLRQTAFSALRKLLSGLARRKTIVIHIDDLQWGDLDSADLLAELLLPADSPPLLLLLSYRSEYVGRSPSLEAIGRLGADAESEVHRTELPVGSLAPDETRQLATSILGSAGSAETVEWIVRESEGVTFFVYELALYAREADSRKIESGADLERVLWTRIGRYPTPASRLLEVIAVAAQPLSLRSAQAAAGVGMLAPELLASLRAGNLLRGSGAGLHDQVESYHDRVREIVSDRLEPERLRTIHAALAKTFELHEEGGPERLARHYLESGQLTAAGVNFEKAADQAVRALAFDRAEEFFRKSIELAEGMRQRALRQEKIIHFYTDAARFDEAYGAGREALAALGVSLPARFRKPAFLVDLITARLRLGWRKIQSLIDLPEADEEKHLLAIRLLSAVGKAAYQLRPELCIAVLVKSVNACLAKGNTPDAAVGFMAFGSIFLGGILGRRRDGYEFGRLSLDIVDKYQDDLHRAEVNFVVGYFGTSWLRPARNAEELFVRAFEAGQESGDLFHTGCACAAGVMHRFMRGVPLAELLEETGEHLEFLGKLRLRETLGCVRSTRQAIRNLMGETESRTSFTVSDFDETAFRRELSGYGSRHFAHYHHINRMIAMTHWNEIDAGMSAAEASMEYLEDSRGMLHSAEHLFYRAMLIAAAGRRTRAGGRQGRTEVRHAARRYEIWARDCPENFQARALLLNAELALLRGKPDRALLASGESAKSAARYRQPQIAALAHRCAAHVLLEQADFGRADAQRQLAAESYRRWGTDALAEFWAAVPHADYRKTSSVLLVNRGEGQPLHRVIHRSE